MAPRDNCVVWNCIVVLAVAQLTLVTLAAPLALRDKPHPRGYVVLRVPPAAAPAIDGDVDSDAAWAAAPWCEDFGSIYGPSATEAPKLRTRFKLLWDDANLYLAAWMEDPTLFANHTTHDSMIYFDNNLELFMDPDGDAHNYMELEFNGLGQVWDLLMVRPYRNGGPALMSWESVPPAVQTEDKGRSGWSPMRHAVRVDGAINAKEGTKSWQLEAALPWTLLQQIAGRRAPPHPGDQWRAQLARMVWNVVWDGAAGAYVQVPGSKPHTLTWAPQYIDELHQPESWGYLQFDGEDVLSRRRGAPLPQFVPDPSWPARALLMDVHAAQWAALRGGGAFAKQLSQLGPVGAAAAAAGAAKGAGAGGSAAPAAAASGAVRDVQMQATEFSFVASAEVVLPSGEGPAAAASSSGGGGSGDDPCKWPRAPGGGWAVAGSKAAARVYVTEQGRVTLAFPGVPGAGFRPDQGSRWC